MKKSKYALVVGRFEPMHKGHEALINEALKLANTVVIFVTKNKTNTLPVYERIKLIEMIYLNEINEGKIIVSEFVNPSKIDITYGDHIFDKFKEITNLFPEVIVYGSDKDINLCFKEELISNLKLVKIDRNDISATKIRKYIKEEEYDKLHGIVNDAITSEIIKFKYLEEHHG